MDPMDLSVLEGEIAAVEDAIKLELEFAEFDEDEMWMPEIGECIKKLEELRKELMEKLRAINAKKPTMEQEPSKEVVRKVAEKIKELKKLMQKLNEKTKEKERSVGEEAQVGERMTKETASGKDAADDSAEVERRKEEENVNQEKEAETKLRPRFSW